MNQLISVIIPVYNIEKYIEKCVNSLVNQTYDNIEIILVDDGTPDNSGSICDELAKKHKNIVVIHKKNGGVSSARNAGIDKANGEYICFVDGDDYVSDTYIKDLADVIVKNEADIATSNAYMVWDDKTYNEIFALELPTGKSKVMTGSDSLSDMLYGKTCSAACWGKLFKKDLFSEVRFPAWSLGEDSYTMYQCFLKSKTVVHLHKPNYYYLQHNASALHTDNYDKFYDYIQLSDKLIRIISCHYPDLFLPAVNRLVENNFWVYIKMRNYPTRYEKEIKHITDNIKKYRKFCLKDKNVCLRTRMACLLSYGGMHMLNKIYDLQK